MKTTLRPSGRPRKRSLALALASAAVVSAGVLVAPGYADDTAPADSGAPAVAETTAPDDSEQSPAQDDETPGDESSTAAASEPGAAETDERAGTATTRSVQSSRSSDRDDKESDGDDDDSDDDDSDDDDDEVKKKVVICKFAATPGQREKFQTINIVSVNSLGTGPNGETFDGTFPYRYFADAQDLTVAIRFPKQGENTNDASNDPQTIQDCSGVLPKPAAPKVTDPCGAANAQYVLPDDEEPYTWTRDLDARTATVTVSGKAPSGLDYVLDLGNGNLGTSFTYSAPTDSGTLCVDPPTPTVSDPCDTGNVTLVFPTTPGLVVMPLDGGYELTPAPGYAFRDGAASKFVFTPAETNVEPCTVSQSAPDRPSTNDPCGVGNATFVTSGYLASKPGEFSVTFSNGDTTVTIAAEGNVVFDTADGPQTVITYTVEETNTLLCVTPPVPTVKDECGPGNATYDFDANPGYTVSLSEGATYLVEVAEGYEFTDGRKSILFVSPSETNVAACPAEVAPADLVACVAPSSARTTVTTTLLGTISLVTETLAKANGFAGVFPFTYTTGGQTVTIVRAAAAGETAASVDAAVACGVRTVVTEEPDAEVAGAADSADGAATAEAGLPDTGGPAGWLAPFGAALVLAGLVLVLRRRA